MIYQIFYVKKFEIEIVIKWQYRSNELVVSCLQIVRKYYLIWER